VNILVVGSGGREHALVWKLAQSPRIEKLWCSPGNAGIGAQAEIADLKDTNISGLLLLAQEMEIDLTIIGPEAPLCLGIVDAFQREGRRVFGPSKRAAELEFSKIFAKRLMKKYGIPTADFAEFDNPQDALAYVKRITPPIVVKADGLAAGKGVIICHSNEEAAAAVHTIMEEKAFGEAGWRVVVEEYMVGQEATLMAFCAGKDYFVMPAAQDHKPVFDNDQGPNTGGMGCYSPVPIVTPELQCEVEAKIIAPVLSAMAAEGRPYYGVLYTGLMLTEAGPKVVEFNCRFGDPETQVILPLLESDLVDLIVPIAEGRICETPRWKDSAATCVVMASGGYPGKYEPGKVISGLDAAEKLDDVVVFHAATRKLHGQIQTSGGRVLGVAGLGDDLQQSVQRAYDAVAQISWEGAHYRKDIAAKAMK
jgi:phosphoribosylamine---glycine ligase